MLLENFYKIEKMDVSGDSSEEAVVTFELNPEHPVYSGHFPGNPIVPGVCQVQLVKEILERIAGKDLMMVKAHNIKYMDVMVPAKDDVYSLELKMADKEDGVLQLTAQIKKEEKIYFKFKGNFIVG